MDNMGCDVDMKDTSKIKVSLPKEVSITYKEETTYVQDCTFKVHNPNPINYRLPSSKVINESEQSIYVI